MNAKTLKDKLVRGDTVYGTMIQHATNPAIVDIIPANALDFVIVTAEHNALDIADFLPMRYALNAQGHRLPGPHAQPRPGRRVEGVRLVRRRRRAVRRGRGARQGAGGRGRLPAAEGQGAAARAREERVAQPGDEGVRHERALRRHGLHPDDRVGARRSRTWTRSVRSPASTPSSSARTT